MSPSINYVIATCAADRGQKVAIAEHALAIQLYQLQQIFKQKQSKQLSNWIAQITIVIPPVIGKRAFEHYYDKSLKNLEGVPVVYLDYYGANKHASYDQWIQAYMAFPEFDYTIIIEDDYCFDIQAVTFDQDWVQIYKSAFPDNIGYLSQWACIESRTSNIHAAVSNGLISRESWERLGSDPLALFYACKTYHCQLDFSVMWSRVGVPLADTKQAHKLTFFHTTALLITHFVSPKELETQQFETKPVSILTVQEADTLHDYSKLSAKNLWLSIKESQPWSGQQQIPIRYDCEVRAWE